MSDERRVQFMRLHGVTVARWNDAGELIHCELGAAPTAENDAQTKTDPQTPTQAEDEMMLALAATGGPVRLVTK